MIRGFDIRRSLMNRTLFARNFRTATAAIAVILASHFETASGAQVLLEPMTTGTYSWDWLGAPVNQGAGFDTLTTMTVGAYQKGTITRNYRSYMVFDTLDSQSPILSATLDLTITQRTTNSLTNPQSALYITLGLPTEFSAQEIADPQFSALAPAGTLIYDDLATNGFRTVSIPFGDVIQPTVNGDLVISTTMPLAFIAAFNQARSSNRFLTVSLFGGDYGMYSADMAITPRLVVNNLTPVPEPMGWVCLSVGIGVIVVRKGIHSIRAGSLGVTAHVG